MEAGRKAEVAKAVKEATTVAERKLKLIRQSQDATIAARVNAERQAAAKRLTEAVNTEKVKAFKEKAKLTVHLEDMKRRLEQRTPQDLGDEGEIQVLEALQQAFDEDEFTRTAKGAAGGDIEHRIVHKGTIVGSILYDHKNTKTYLSKWLPKSLIRNRHG